MAAAQRQTMRSSVGAAEYERYAPLVRRIAKRMVRRLPPDIAIADLVAYGWVGLLEANARADASMTEDEFEAYASHRVRGAMLDHLRSLDPLARRTRAKSREIAQAVSTLTRQLGRAPEENEIAAELKLTVESYRAVLQEIGERGMARLDVIDVDMLEHDDEQTDDRVARKMLVDDVAAAIDTLPERLRTVVALHHQEGCTLAQIGQVLGVTEARVCQLHSEAMHRLRAAIGRS